jgi:hypothetical protein
MTDDLIARLAHDLKPVSSHAVAAHIASALAIGLVVSAGLMLVMLGARPNLAEELGSSSFILKVSYTLALGSLGLWATSRMARPGEDGRLALSIVPAVVGLIAIAALIGYTNAAPETRHQIVFGSSALVCPIYILALSIPLLISIIVVMRRMASTRPQLAGFSAGLMAGGLGALVYSFHCPEPGVPFVALWYSSGILATALVGTALGGRYLRW